jgi:hypothetical protein
MTPPPDPEMRSPAAANGRADRKDFHTPQQNTETPADIQVRTLRQRLAVGYSLAASLAPLIWGMPR